MARNIKIGNLTLANPVIAAPMAGVTDKAFRILAREAGCGLVCTEMVSDQAILYGNPHTCRMLDLKSELPPISVQIFGSHPKNMAKAAKIVEACGADLIDINMGCPTPKIIKNGEGAALMKDPAAAKEIVAAVVEAVNLPITVKMRKGWDETSANAVEVAQAVVAGGAAAVIVHGRTRSQFYSGRADWEIIKAVKEAIQVPVIGNGDIFSPLDAERMMVTTGCDGVMIGRAALGNPWVFTQTVHYLATGELLPEPAPQMKIDMAIRHLSLLIKIKGEKVAVWEIRKHASWYTKGIKGAARLREKINLAKTPEEVKTLLMSIITRKILPATKDFC